MSGILGRDALGAFVLGSMDTHYLITDRTIEDVNRLACLHSLGYKNMTDAEKAEWAGDLKGAYNYTDLNRVEAAVAYLAAELRELPEELREYADSLSVAWDIFFVVPYDAEAVNPETKTDWRVSDIHSAEDMDRYLSNVVMLRNVLDYATDELPESMEGLTYSGANAIEKALVGLEIAITLLRSEKKKFIDNTAAAWYYSGEIYAGEV